ncbi:hypothetical protein [Rhizobium sp. BK376]|uniref:hypothetical protein n=1 Tax=Rhizobium sp. BK376 TaxID=2512149 RepID=UPI00104AB8E3|nr:hypothetical protein [Rhizobium sp. BK376]TCR92569.1 hypothetical protein EV561_1012 [Rhizobium sp. BK376]
MKTDTNALESLFDTFADGLSKLLREGRTAVNKDGEIVQLTPDAATFNVIRQFLKDTGTTVAPGKSEKVNSIVENLPFGLPEDDNTEAYH